MTTDNPSWGAPRIHGELLMLGFEVSDERSLDDEASAASSEPAKRWLAFLRNHREAIAAMTSSPSQPLHSSCSTASRHQPRSQAHPPF